MRAKLVVVVAVLLVAACGSGSEESRSVSTLPEENAGTPLEVCAGGFAPTLVAVAIASGDPQWTYCPAAPASFAVVAATQTRVYAYSFPQDQSQGYELLAVDAATGDERWRVPLPSDGTPAARAPGPLAAAGVVVLPGDDPSGPIIVGFDAETGAERWRMPADGFFPVANTETVAVLAEQPPVLVNTNPLSPPSARVRGVERTTGEERWVVDVIAGVQPHPLGAVAGSTVVLHHLVDSVLALDAETGQERWRGPAAVGAGAGAEGVVVGASARPGSSTVTAVDAATGQHLWTAPGFPFNSLWALDDNAVYVHGPDGGMVGLELRTGVERWHVAPATPASLYGAANGVVFVLADRAPGEGTLVGLSAADGQQQWSLVLPLVDEAYATSLAANDRFAFLAIDDFPPTD